MEFYKQQIAYYSQTAYNILDKEIDLILPKFPVDKRQKRGAIIASMLGGIASSLIGLAYEGISSFLHHKRHKALKKAVHAIDKKTDIQCNTIYPLEDTIKMYGVYNSNTLTDLIYTMQRMHTTSTWKERTFSGRLNQWFDMYLQQEGIHCYAINSVFYLTSVREKYVKMYKRFIEELRLYSKVIRILWKGYLPISLLTPSKLERILSEVKIAMAKSNKDYNLVLTRLYLYYDMKLVTFEIDSKRNLIIQFPVFVRPYTQERLTMYQTETVAVPILDENEQLLSYTQLKTDKPHITLSTETYKTLRTQELYPCKKIGYEYYYEELFVVKSKTKYSCSSAIYFNLSPEIIKEN